MGSNSDVSSFAYQLNYRPAPLQAGQTTGAYTSVPPSKAPNVSDAVRSRQRGIFPARKYIALTIAWTRLTSSSPGQNTAGYAEQSYSAGTSPAKPTPSAQSATAGVAAITTCDFEPGASGTGSSQGISGSSSGPGQGNLEGCAHVACPTCPVFNSFVHL